MHQIDLPERFFSPLASPGRNVYLNILLELFKETENQLGLLSRDFVLSTALEAIAKDDAFAATEDIENEEPAFGVFETDAPDVRRRGRANAILRHLERCGWLMVEVHADFSQNYLLPECSFRILKVLSEMAAKSSASLQGLVCSIHDLLIAALEGGLAHIRVPEAFRQTGAFRAALRELHHNMGTHLERVTKEHQAKQILIHLFQSYRDQIVDKAYHQLRTTDHISRFRPSLVNACEELAQGTRLEAAVAGALAADKELNAEVFRPKYQHMLYSIVESFEQLDSEMEMIDKRHSQFVDTAVSSIERLVTDQATTSGHARSILESFLKSADSEADQNSYTEDLIELYMPKYLDSLSPNIPRKAASRFQQQLAPHKPISKKLIEAERKKTAMKLIRNLGREKIKLLAEAVLQDKASCLASDILLKGPEDLPIIIYLREYGDGSLGYKAVPVTPNSWIKAYGVGFYNFVICRVQ